MARFSYTGTLDRNKILEAELNQRFTDLANKANTTKFDIDSIRERSVRYRHYLEPPTIFARHELTGAAIHGALNKAGAWNWTNIRIKHSQTSVNAPNGSEAGNPVIHVHGEYWSHDWEHSAYELGIGYSTDNAVSFSLWGYTNKFFGYTEASATPRWTGMTTHYHTGVAANWYSKTFYSKRIVHTGTGAMSQGGVNIANVTHWAIGIRVNGPAAVGTGTHDIHPLDVGRLWLISRDST